MVIRRFAAAVHSWTRTNI